MIQWGFLYVPTEDNKLLSLNCLLGVVFWGAKCNNTITFAKVLCEFRSGCPRGRPLFPCLEAAIKRQRTLLAAAVFCLITVPMGSVAAPPPTRVAVDPAVQFQTWQGWGTSLAWWANVVGTFAEPARADYLTKAFDPARGLGLTVLRYNIGGGENPQFSAPAQSFLTLRSAVPGFEPSPGRWDWNADAGQRTVLLRALQMGADQVEAFSNSPPYWMTQSGSVTGGHDGTDNLRVGAVESFADYLATVVRHYRDAWGVTFRTLEPLNEPSGHWRFGNGQEGCHVSRPLQSVVVQSAAAALARQGVRTTVAASDEPTIGDAVATFQSCTPDALAAMSKINTHSYGGGDRTYLFAEALSAGKDLWLSEYGDNDASGLTLSRTILQDIRGLHPSAWVYWQFVDAAPGWGFLRNPLDSASHTRYTVNKKFWVMAQYSRFIRPGARFIAVADPHTVAAWNAQSRTLTLVTTNSGDAPSTVCYDLRKFTHLGAFAQARQTSPNADLAPLRSVSLIDKQLTVTLPSRSVTTWIVHEAVFIGPQAPNPRVFCRLFSAGSGRTVSAEDTRSGFLVSARAPGRGWEQQWAVVGQGDGTYGIFNRRSGLALSIDQAGLVQARDSGAPGQRWHLDTEPGGLVHITNCASGQMLSVPGVLAHQWRLVLVGSQSSPVFAQEAH